MENLSIETQAILAMWFGIYFVSALLSCGSGAVAYRAKRGILRWSLLPFVGVLCFGVVGIVVQIASMVCLQMLGPNKVTE